MLKKELIWAAKTCVAGVLAIGVITLFTLFYRYTGVHSPNPSGATDYTWEPNQLVIDHMEGGTCLRFDPEGFNNPDYRAEEPVDILMIGDSQLEAAHVAASEGVCSRLNALRPELYAYNIALGAHDIYVCTKNMESAVREYAPDVCVIMDLPSVGLSIEEMRRVIDGTYPTIPSYNGSILSALQKWVPGIKQLYKQLEDWLGAGGAEELAAEDYASQEYRECLDRFLRKSAAPAAEAGIPLVIYYIPTVELSPEGELVCNTDADALAAFERACADNGIVFVDMTDTFERLYSEERKLPYGFVNTRVGKGHMNRDGYRVIAQELVEVIDMLKG